MPCLLENLRRHIAGCTTRRCEYMKSLLVHNPAQPEICYEQIGIVLGRPEQQILRFQITVYDTVVMEVGYSAKSCPYQVCGIGFVVGTFATYAIEELAAEGEISYQID